MIHLPFINKYPYTSMEAVNIDWLLNEVSKIPVLEEKVNQHETRITDLETTAADHEERLTAAEGDIDSLEGRMDTAEGDIDSLEGRMDTAEGDIDSLEGRMDTAEGDIDSLEGRMDTAEGDIDSLEGRMDTAEGDIQNIQTKDQAQDNDLSALDSRVTALEGKEVTANPGGSGPALNTLKVGSQVYSVPQGGGGGTGTVVTANPAGVLPTDPELSALGIDSLNYRIPVTAADKAAIEGDISDIQNDITDIQNDITNIESAISSLTSLAVEKDILMSVTPSGSSVVEVPGSSFTLQPGLYIINYYAEFDTSDFGSAQRDIGLYMRDSDNENLMMDKFHINGNETASITQAATLQFTKIMSVASATTLHAGVRCQKYTGSDMNYGYDVWIRAIKLG